jgi:hypothetical protein
LPQNQYLPSGFGTVGVEEPFKPIVNRRFHLIFQAQAVPNRGIVRARASECVDDVVVVIGILSNPEEPDERTIRHEANVAN